MSSMQLHEAQRAVHAAQSWRDLLRFVGRRGWSGLAYWHSVYPTFEEALEAADIALEQAEERLAAELMARLGD